VLSSELARAPRRISAAAVLRELGLTLAALDDLRVFLWPGWEAGATAWRRHVRAPGGRRSATAAPAGPRQLAGLGRPGNIAFFTLLAVLVTGWWVVLRPTSFLGGPATFVVIRGTSMLPTLHTGDLVIAEAQSSYQVGEVVVYQVPRGQPGAGDDLIHRIVGGSAAAGYVLQGDNNAAPDPWTVPAADIRGKEALHVSGTGGWLLVLHSPLFLGVIGALVAMSLVLWPPGWMRRLLDGGGGPGR
jgi:signal peptidase I